MLYLPSGRLLVRCPAAAQAPSMLYNPISAAMLLSVRGYGPDARDMTGQRRVRNLGSPRHREYVSKSASGLRPAEGYAPVNGSFRSRALATGFLAILI